MPDTNLAKSLLTTAKSLTKNNPSQAKLRRAVSTAYYAVFHALARTCADELVGRQRAKRSNKAWVEVYRGLSHGPCKNSCKGAHKINFPPEIKNFADTFVQLQEAREQADYDPTYKLTLKGTLVHILLAEVAINSLKTVPSVDKTAFAAWVLITTHGATQARKQAKAANEA